MKTKSKTPFYFKFEISLKLILLSLTFILLSESVFAHGTVIWPKSRIKNCHENPTANNCGPCGNAIYSWRSILQPDTRFGRHRDFVPDGQLASGGNSDKYGCLDALIGWPTQNDWITTKVNYGDIFVKWQNTAPHKTQYYKVYITPLDWDPSKPLNWNDLIEIGHVGKRPAEDFTTIKANIPDSYIGKRAALYSVWQRDYTQSHEAFYSVSDIEVVASGGESSDDGTNQDDGSDGGHDHGDGDGDQGGGDDSGTSNCTNIVMWDNTAIYVADNLVQYQNNLYRAKWWTKNNNPVDYSGQWDVWENKGGCAINSKNTNTNTKENSFSIRSNSPNPFHNSTTINYEVFKPVKSLSMTVRTLSNQIVLTAFSNKRKSVGKHIYTINTKSLHPGIYLCVIESNNGLFSIKKILVK